MDYMLKLLLEKSDREALEYLGILIFEHTRFLNITEYEIPKKIGSRIIKIVYCEDYSIKFFCKSIEMKEFSEFEISEIFSHLKILKDVLYEFSNN